MVRCGLYQIARLLLVCFALARFGSSTDSLPPIIANQNQTAAGILRNGVLTVQLEIGKGEWHPEADDGIALSVYAFGEAGRPLQNPGPLIRVLEGTDVRASLHNTLAVPITVHGLGEPGSRAVVHIGPGGIERVRFKATMAGLYFYWGAAEADNLKLRHGIDTELTGAFVVDPPGAGGKDEIFSQSNHRAQVIR
jgi:FtsP/CotA-like multicopper oxidase with cupredoxin domain